MDKKFIWATTMKLLEEGSTIATLDISGCVKLHSEKETVDKITEILNRCNESHKMNFEAYNKALEMNKSLLPDTITFDYKKMSKHAESETRRVLRALYKQEKNDFQTITFCERRSVEDIEKITYEYKKNSDTIESLINTLKTKGIDVDLCRWLPAYTKFFPIEVYYNPLIKEESPIIKDCPEKKGNSLDKNDMKLWTVTNNENKILAQTVNGLLVLDALYSEACKNVNINMSVYANIIRYRITSEDHQNSSQMDGYLDQYIASVDKLVTTFGREEVWFDFNKTDDIALYRAMEEVFKNKEFLKSRITSNGIETKYRFSDKKSNKAISDIAKKYYDAMTSFKNIKSEITRLRNKALLRGYKLKPEDFSRLSKLFNYAGLDISIESEDFQITQVI